MFCCSDEQQLTAILLPLDVVQDEQQNSPGWLSENATEFALANTALHSRLTLALASLLLDVH